MIEDHIIYGSGAGRVGPGPVEGDPGAALDSSDRTRCEVWTRVMGYHRPVSAFNRGKRAEHGERRYFTERVR